MKALKKVLLGVLSLACVITASVGLTACNSVGGTTQEQEGVDVLAYTLLSDGTYAVSQGNTMYLEEIVIPSTYNGKAVTMIADNAFSEAKVKSITIPDSVTSIGDRAFEYCYSLTSVVIPDSVTSIGDFAFYNCESLTSVVIPDSVTSIGDYAFQYCSSLTSVVIGDSVTSIGYDAFYHCDSLTSVICPAFAISYIPKGNLQTVVITSGEFIDSDAFEDCDSLTSVVIPDSVTSIGEKAFLNCSSLTSVVIPDSVTSIGEGAFYNCRSLTSVYITDIALWCNISGLYNLMGYGSSDKKLYLNNELVTDLVIPDSVTEIGSSAFSGCSSLTSVVIPDSVTSIGDYAFSNCSSLTSVVIPDSVTSIGGWAFSYCDSLTSIEIPDSVTSIGRYAFSNCSSLTSVVIPDSVTSIGYHAFAYCSSLTSIEIPDSVTSIGNYAFSNCTGLTEIQYNATECADFSSTNYIFADAGQNGEGITVTIGANVKKIPAYMFYPYSSYAPKIVSVVFEEGSVCESIGDYAFRNCSSLTSVVIGDSVTSIGYDAFRYCNSLTSVYYKGSASDWNNIYIDRYNNNLISATRYYYSATQPTESGNYWHYDENGEVVVW